MYLRNGLKFISPFIFLFLYSCSSSLILQNSIPFETQQLIKSVEGNQRVNFLYTSNPEGEVKKGRLHYSINPALNGMLKELMQSKFNSIDSESDNSINITLSKVKVNDDVGAYNVTHTLDITVDIVMIKNKEEMKKSFSYSTSFVLSDANVERKEIENLLLKFIVSIDKFIDTAYKVQ